MKNDLKKAGAASTIGSKDLYWQLIRGICIICVVLIHSKHGTVYQHDPHGSWNYDYYIVVRQFINFPVAVFIFLSGYFTNIEKIKASSFSYIARRLKRLFIPFLVWSALYTIFNIMRMHGPMIPAEELRRFITGEASCQLYFIVVLLQLTAITPFIIKIIESNKGTTALLLITPLWLVALYFYFGLHGHQADFNKSFFPAWFIFYYLGLLIKIRGHKPLFKNKPLEKAIACVIVGLLLSIAEAYGPFPVGFLTTQVKASSVIYALAIINLLIVIKPYVKVRQGLLTYLGDNSYGIFFVHMFVIIISRRMLAVTPAVMDTLPLYNLLQVIFALAVSCLLISLAKRIFGAEFSNKVLGF